MGKQQNRDFFNKYNIRWVITISVGSFILAIIFSAITESSIKNLDTILSFIILFIIIIIGIIFDIFGIAVTKAEEKPFHSMAAKKIDEAKVAIKIIRNAGPVSNFCNDVVGDISGIVSGGIGTTLIIRMTQNYSVKDATIITILMTGAIAAFTVGGKAFGKAIALLYFEEITYGLAKFINLLEKTFKLTLFSNKTVAKTKKTFRDNKVRK